MYVQSWNFWEIHQSADNGFLVFFWKQSSLCFMWPNNKNCPAHGFRTWQDKITFSMSFKEKPRYWNSKKTDLFHLSGLPALSQSPLVNTRSVFMWRCRCINPVFPAMYVNSLVENMTTWHKSREISPNFFDL